MKSLRRFLADTADLLFDLLRAVGLRGPRWEFRKQALRRRLTGLSAEVENVRRGVAAAHKMCRECRTLMPRGARRCPECGATTEGVPRGGPSRFLRLLFPGMASITSVVMTLNFLFYLVSIVLFQGEGPRGGGAFGFAGPHPNALFMLGEKVFLTQTSTGVSGPAVGPPFWQLYRLVMPSLLHGGLLHIGFNSLALMNLGPLAEHLVGRRRFAVVYFVTGVSAFLASNLHPSPSVGASGSLFGLLGFLIVFGRLRAGAAGRALSRYLMTWAMYGLVMILIPFIDNWAHAGGFLAGAALGAVMRGGVPRSRPLDLGLTALTVMVVVAVAASIAGVALQWPANLEILKP